MECNDINYEGKATRINRHPHEPIIAYPSGSSIIICSVMDPSDSFVYKGHSAPTTIAKFSPNVRRHSDVWFLLNSCRIVRCISELTAVEIVSLICRDRGSLLGTHQDSFASGLGIMQIT